MPGIQDHKRVGRDKLLTPDEQRIHVDLADLGVVGAHLSDRLDDALKLRDVDFGQPPQRAEETVRAQSRDQLTAVGGGEGWQRECHISDGLGEDAAEPKGDHRAELLVTAHAHEKLALV